MPYISLKEIRSGWHSLKNLDKNDASTEPKQMKNCNTTWQEACRTEHSNKLKQNWSYPNFPALFNYHLRSRSITPAAQKQIDGQISPLVTDKVIDFEKPHR